MFETNITKILQVLLDNEQPISAKNIAGIIGVSESTVKHSVLEVRRIVEQYGGQLKSVPRVGLCLNVDKECRNMIMNAFDEGNQETYSFDYRRKYILDILFHKKSNYTIQLFADDLEVSRNVILNDLDRIEEWLKLFNIQMIRIQNFGIKVEGNEFDMRQAILDANNQYANHLEKRLPRPDDLDLRVSKTFYNYFSCVYPDNDIYSVQDCVLDIEETLHMQFRDVSFIQLMEYIVISINRIKEGNIILKNNILTKYGITKEELEVSRFIFGQFIDAKKYFLLVEAQCLAVQIRLFGTYDDAFSAQYQNDINDEYVEDFLNQMSHVLVGKKLNISGKLKKELKELYTKKSIQTSYRPINDSYFIKDVKTRLASLYSVVVTYLDSARDTLHIDFNESDVAYITMLIDNACEDIKVVVHTLFITSFDEHIANYKIKKMISEFPIIKVDRIVNLKELKNEDLSNYDLAITTVLIDNDEIVKVSRRMDDEDLLIIKNKLSSIISCKQGNQAILRNWINPDLALFNYKTKKREKALLKGSELLEEKGYTIKGFYEALVKRDNLISTALGNGVAIPHVFKESVVKSGVSVIKLDHPIQWHEHEKVCLIFIFAINTDDANTFSHFFRSFYQLMNSKETLDKLENAKDIEEFISVLRAASLSIEKEI